MNYLEQIAAQIKPLLPEDAQNLDGTIYLYLAAICRIKGGAVTASDVHDLWAAWATTNKPGHKCLLPWQQLDTLDQDKDFPFMCAVQKVAKGLINE